MHNVDCATELEKQWFAIYTRSSFEKRVGEHFAVRNIDYFLPTYRIIHRWKNRCTKTIYPVLFPGYIFVQILPTERIRVLEVPGVVYIVGTQRKPTPLPGTWIDSLRTGAQMYDIEPHPYLAIGQRARINQGPFIGLEGIIVRKTNALRVILSLDMIMKSISVELDESYVELI